MLLAAAEKELWKCLLRINLGSSAMSELVTFLQRYEALELQHAGEDLELDWFAPDRKHLIHPLPSINSIHLQEWGHLPSFPQQQNSTP
jgi:hypothetical protein